MLRIRSLLAHAKVRFFATSAPKVYTATDLKGWGVSRVVEYAEKELELGAKAASVLREQEIIGKSLLNLSKEDLLRANMPLGPATILAAAIAKLPRPSGEYLAGTSCFRHSCAYLVVSHRLPSISFSLLTFYRGYGHTDIQEQGRQPILGDLHAR